MPAGMRIRYDKPVDDLADYFTGYHAYVSRGPTSIGQTDWFLPGTANVRVALHAGPINVSIGARTFDPLPSASLFGPTSQAIKAVTNGGLMIGFGISALGWARVTRKSASEYRDRIVALPEVFGEVFSQRLVAALAASDGDQMVKPLLDNLLRALLGPPHPDEPMIRTLMALIVVDGHTEISSVSEELGISSHSLRRLAVRYFGMTPKILLSRARFLRSFLRLMQSGDTENYALIDKSYFDVPHFLRDSSKFLGMTPRRFRALSKPFLSGSLRARAAVLGHATQALHDIGNK